MEQTGPALLIADDEEPHRVALREILAPVGYRTLFASNGEEAIRVVENRLVDGLLLDMHMPDLNGLETLRIVREIDAGLPCIMITADASPDVLEEALSLRAFTVLTKPVRRQTVPITVRRALRAARRLP